MIGGSLLNCIAPSHNDRLTINRYHTRQTMQQPEIALAAQFLIERRNNPTITNRLAPELRPTTTEDALAIQKVIMEKMGDKVGGWKCVLPAADKLNVAPIFAKTIYDKSPCLVKLDNGVCSIEPELAFRFKQDLPPRDAVYSDAEIKAALAGSHLALELIEKRYNGTEEVGYLENLADCLFNQGMYLGPEVSLENAIAASELDFILTQGEARSFKGSHPNNAPILPVFWLVNFLRQAGIGIKAGQVVITGSFAGVHEVTPGIEFSMDYIGLGTMRVLLNAST